jgi:hypothetical protein
VRAAPAKNRRLSTIGGISSDRVTAAGFPTFCASSFTISSACSSIRSANLSSASCRSFGVESNQSPSKARLAAATARSASSLVPSCTVASTSPVAGLITSRVCPSDEFTHSPSMNI